MDGIKKLDFPKKSVLIVEDDEDIGRFVALAIEEETPYRATLVSDSLQALDSVTAQKPDLIILDYRLPGMNGIQFYERLLTYKDLATIPVVLVSADAPEQEVRRHHLTLVHKPFDLDRLLDIVDKKIAQPIPIMDYRVNDIKQA